MTDDGRSSGSTGGNSHSSARSQGDDAPGTPAADAGATPRRASSTWCSKALVRKCRRDELSCRKCLKVLDGTKPGRLGGAYACNPEMPGCATSGRAVTGRPFAHLAAARRLCGISVTMRAVGGGSGNQAKSVAKRKQRPRDDDASMPHFSLRRVESELDALRLEPRGLRISSFSQTLQPLLFSMHLVNSSLFGF